MTSEGQRKTAETYLDPDFVARFAARTKPEGEIVRLARGFADRVPGRRLIDVGCGPGYHAHLFADWGYEVVGIDASAAMIEVARAGRRSQPGPQFRVAAMQQVGELFPENVFDGAWISASLLHVPQQETPGVLAGVHRIVVDRGTVFVSLKQGPQGARVVPEEVGYGRALAREFTFWEEERFRRLVEDVGFSVQDCQTSVYGTTGGVPTHWLAYLLRVEKTAGGTAGVRLDHDSGRS
jgi:ubiquinone/menaquinone biosynthesis C-methylase UbiE